MWSSRQRLGYTYASARQWRVANITKPNMNIDNNISKDYITYEAEMGGEGVIDLAKSGYQKAKNAVTKAADFYSSEVGKRVIDLLPDSDENARPGFKGEKHVIMELANGKAGVANFMGPGTEVVKRVARGDKGRTPSDNVAMRHDIDYQIATGMKTKAAQRKAGRDADNRMISSIKRLEATGGDARKNILMGKAIIAKTMAEDIGVMSKDKFLGKLEKMSDKDAILLKSKRAELSQMGYGHPGEKLKHKLMMKHSGKGLGGDGLGGDGYKLAGRHRQRGRGKAKTLMDFIKNGLVPNLASSLGMTKMPVEMIMKILKQQNPKTASEVSTVLSKILMPVILKSKNITKLTPELGTKLKSGITKAVNFYMKNKKQSGSGVSLAGGAYFQPFAKSFNSM